MKTVSQLTDFYYVTLYPKLKDLEEKRNKTRFRLILFIITVVLSAIFVFIMLMRNNIPAFEAFIFLGMFSFSTIVYIIKHLSKEYKQKFKDEIFHPLIKEIDTNLKYLQDNHISATKFNASNLFGRPDRINGNDHISGRIDEVAIEFSDVHAERKQKNNKDKDKWVTIFQGLYIITDFPKEFHGKTYIFPDIAEKTFGNLIGGWIQSNNFRKEQLVKMDNVEFEKYFAVYSTDQIEARYILSHSLMQKIVTLRKKANHNLSISFANNHLYIAINYGKDLFEPSLFQSLLDYKVAMEYIQVLSMTLGLVRELKLNEKLWSKH